MSDLKAVVACVPKEDGGREVMLSIGTQDGGIVTSVCLSPKDVAAVVKALNTGAAEASRVIVTPTGVITS